MENEQNIGDLISSIKVSFFLKREGERARNDLKQIF